ncbi:MAG: peptidase BlaR1, partial [Myxococcaceae bacterium]|nr:peptidase BlaR1 [Myxococcaceae bacterium]
MAEHLAEAILHTLISALAVEALLRLWRVEEPGFQLRFRLMAIALPFGALPLFEWLAPFRHQAWFEDRFALFSGRRWGALSAFGLRLDWLWLGVFAAFGAALLLLDLVPLLKARRAAARSEEPGGDPALEQRLTELCARLHLPTPSLRVLETSAVALYCTGVRQPVVVASRGALDRLDDRELEVALAHELGHLTHRDVLLGWVLMGARVLHAFNPALQVVSR